MSPYMGVTNFQKTVRFFGPACILRESQTPLWICWRLTLCSTLWCSVDIFIVYTHGTCPLPSARQHSSYGDCLEVKRKYYQNSSVLDCVTQCVHSLQRTYMSSSYRSNRLCLSHWDPYTVHRGGCLEL